MTGNGPASTATAVATAPEQTAEKVRWWRKDLLALQDLSREEIELLLDSTDSFKEVSSREVKKVPALQGKTIANLFFEASTRTRSSFELAAKRLSADTVNLTGSTSSTEKGESLTDTARAAETRLTQELTHYNRVDIQFIRGNQPHYAYLFAVE